MTITYKATIARDDGEISPSRRGDGAYLTSYEHSILEYVEHWKMHALMDFPKAIITITKIEEEPVT